MGPKRPNIPAHYFERIVEDAFKAYNEEGPTPWKTFDGRDVPRWDAISEAVREKWRAAVASALCEVEGWL